MQPSEKSTSYNNTRAHAQAFTSALLGLAPRAPGKVQSLELSLRCGCAQQQWEKRWGGPHTRISLLLSPFPFFPSLGWMGLNLQGGPPLGCTDRVKRLVQPGPTGSAGPTKVCGLTNQSGPQPHIVSVWPCRENRSFPVSFPLWFLPLFPFSNICSFLLVNLMQPRSSSNQSSFPHPPLPRVQFPPLNPETSLRFRMSPSSAFILLFD